MPRLVYITMDGLHDAALREAAQIVKQRHGVDVQLGLHQTVGLRDEHDWARLEQDVERGDFLFGAMLFSEDVVRPMQAMLAERQKPTVIITSNPALIYETKLGKLSLKPVPDEEQGFMQRMMGKLRPKKGKSEGQRQTALLKNLTKLMKYVPGKVRDLHTFIAMHDYYLHSSPENLARQMALVMHRYVPGHEHLPAEEPIAYPDAAIYHPDADAPFANVADYQAWRRKTGRANTSGTVGLLTMRAILLSGNTGHIDGIIRAIEAQGLEARAAYSALLDFRPAITQFFAGENGLSKADALVNCMGFPLVGGPAGARPDLAVPALKAMDVPYYDFLPLSFQRIEEWRKDEVGLAPMQVAMNIALPELDGSAEPVVFGGPTLSGGKFRPNERELSLAARRMARRIRLQKKANADKKIAITLFNFPPNLGNIGTAAFLDVFNSLHRLLTAMHEQGYLVDLPTDVDALRSALVEGNAALHGTDGNVADKLSLKAYRDGFPWYPEIETYWGSAPGQLNTDGRNFQILGAHFGNVFVGLQPGFGYERDPMRLLMGKDASPHHGFAAYYTWLDQVYDADAVLHFGTHGALEFMPGKQNGVSADCWPQRLLGALPNFYYYCVNNPSEGSIAKRRGAATLVSYMVPPLQQAGLYKGLRRLKDTVEAWQKRHDAETLTDIRTQADMLGIQVEHEPLLNGAGEQAYIAALGHELIQVEQRMIPMGLHILNQAPSEQELVDMLALIVSFNGAPSENGKMPPLLHQIISARGHDFKTLQKALHSDPEAQRVWESAETLTHQVIDRFVKNGAEAATSNLTQSLNLPASDIALLWPWLTDLKNRIVNDQELEGLLHGLDGGFIAPSPGNDVVRNEMIVPTGRNIHALDPYRVPTAAAVLSGTQLVDQMLRRLTVEQGTLPETVAMVLWGTDNLKSDGEGIAQCLALIGAKPIEDELGNVARVELIPLQELDRPRIDIVLTISGIFRDLFHNQTELLDKAIRMAAQADEPLEMNFVRKHVLEQSVQMNIPLDQAATRVYCNAPGSYGANVNHLVESSSWETDDQLADVFMSRKSFAYKPGGKWTNERDLMENTLATVDATFQNIDSFEMGISDVDHYYEYLGGVAKSVEKLKGERPAVLVADAISLHDRLASLEQMVRLETRTKLLNPKWHEAMLNHGYEGVREIEHRVSNTYGWSATADAVEKWVYDDVAETFLFDEAMRQRMAQANPHATAGIARRLLEAESRGFWDADEADIEQLREVYHNLEDRLEGVVS